MRVIRPFDLEQSETKERDIELLPNLKNEMKFKLRCYEQQAFESYASQGKKRVAEVVDSESVYEGDSSLDYDEVSRVLDKVEREFFFSPPTTSEKHTPATVPETGHATRDRHIRQALQATGIDPTPRVIPPSLGLRAPTHSSAPFPQPGTPLPEQSVSTKLHTAPVKAIISVGPATDKAINNLGLEDQWIISLRRLLVNHRSSRWTTILMTWGLSQDDAQVLSDALLSDIHQADVLDVSFTFVLTSAPSDNFQSPEICKSAQRLVLLGRNAGTCFYCCPGSIPLCSVVYRLDIPLLNM